LTLQDRRALLAVDVAHLNLKALTVVEIAYIFSLNKQITPGPLTIKLSTCAGLGTSGCQFER